MSVYGIYDEDLYDDDQVQITQKKYNTKPQVTPEQAARAAALVNKYPNISPSVVVGYTNLGLDIDDPRLEEIITKDYLGKEEANNLLKKTSWNNTSDYVKAPFRYLFAGFQGIWEEGAPRAVRYLEARQQGQSHEEAKKNSYVGLLGGLKQGVDVELGSGIFPSATEVENVEEYQNMINNGVDPVKAREFVKNSILQENIYETARLRAEQNIQFVGERAKKFEDAGLEPTVTIGRYLFKPFDRVVEPGTEAYNIVTGLIDIAAQLVLDPTSWITAGFSKLGKAKKVFTSLDEVATFEKAGLIGAARKTLSGPTTKQFLASPTGRQIKEYLWENADNPGAIISNSKENIKSYSFLKNLYETKLNNSGSFDEIGDELVSNLLDEKTVIEVTRGNVPKKITEGNRLTKVLEKTYGPRVTLGDKDNALVQMNRFIQTATKDIEKQKDFLTKTIKALDEDDAITSINNLLIETLENTIRPQLIDALKPEAGSRTEQWINEATKVFKSFSDDIAESKEVMGLYATDTTGAALPINDLVKELGGTTADLLTRPTTTTQLANEIFLPKYNDIQKATKILNSRLGKVGQDIINSSSKEAVSRTLDWYYGTIWKPLVLLRPAWTTRVIMEEQMRLLSSGVATSLNSPISFIASMFKKGDNFYPKVGLLGSFENNAAMQEALVNTTGTLRSLRRRWGKTSEWTVIEKGVNNKRWGEAAFRNVMQLYFDPLSKRLAKIQAIDDGVEYNKALTLLKEEISDVSTSLNEKLRKVTGSKSHPFYGAADNRELADEFVDYLNANIASSTGGKVVTDPSKKAAEWIQDRGDKRLLDLISTEDAKFLKKEFDNLTDVEKAKYWAGELDTETYNRISETLAKNQKSIVKTFIKEFGDVLPNSVRGEIEITSGISQKYDAVVNKLFNGLMSVPTNKLSRSPAFKQFYWENVAKNAKFATDDVLTLIKKQADEANLSSGPKELKALYKKIQNSKGNIDGINDLELFDKISSAEALTRTRELLYDVTTKSKIGNATRLLFPFGEAYLEIFTTWAKIIGAEGGRPARRVQQIIEAGRKPNPILDESGQKGFFYKNPRNGQEVFGYPGEGLLQNWMFKELEEGGVNVNLPVYLSSVNIAANVIPGFGPIIQIPVAYLNQKLPGLLEEEGLIQTLVFGDFAPPKVGTLNELTKSIVPFPPSWLNKLVTAFEQNSDEAERLYANTTIDVYKAMLYAGLANDSSPEAAEISLDQASEYAKKILIIRAISQFLGPAGAATPEFELTTESGTVYLFEQLADEYRLIKDSVGGDDTEATRIFIEQFGVDPIALATSKSQSVRKRPMTVDGANWARENKELYEEFKNTAWYLNPEDNSEFSYDAYYNALLSGDLIPRTPEQWQRAKNKLLGSIEYENFLRKYELHNRSDSIASEAKRVKQKELMAKYWGYGVNIPGSSVKTSPDELMRELYTWFDPVTYEVKDTLKDFDVAQAWAIYAKERDRIIKNTKELGYSEEGWKTSKTLLPYRTHLRTVADDLFLKYPGFESLYRDILEVELREEYEDQLLLESLQD